MSATRSRGDDVPPTRPLPEIRLRFKRSFWRYYLDLCSAGIATPGEAYDACIDYLRARACEWGPERFEVRLEEDIVRLTGEIEQDLRRRYRHHANDFLARESLEGRLRECLEIARARLGPPLTTPGR